MEVKEAKHNLKSSSEAEYRVVAQVAGEVTWVMRLLEEFGVPNMKRVVLHCDNQSVNHIAKKPIFKKEPNVLN